MAVTGAKTIRVPAAWLGHLLADIGADGRINEEWEPL